MKMKYQISGLRYDTFFLKIFIKTYFLLLHLNKTSHPVEIETLYNSAIVSLNTLLEKSDPLNSDFFKLLTLKIKKIYSVYFPEYKNADFPVRESIIIALALFIIVKIRNLKKKIHKFDQFTKKREIELKFSGIIKKLSLLSIYSDSIKSRRLIIKNITSDETEIKVHILPEKENSYKSFLQSLLTDLKEIIDFLMKEENSVLEKQYIDILKNFFNNLIKLNLDIVLNPLIFIFNELLRIIEIMVLRYEKR